MTWAEWKRSIRKTLDATPGFDVETDDIAFFDAVHGETLSLMKHQSGEGFLWGVQSTKDEDSEE